jgi:hypothetical protein
VAKTVRGLAFLAVMAWRDPPASAQTTAPGATLPDGELIDALRLGGYAIYFRHAATNPDVFRPRPDGGFDYMGEIGN